MQKMNYDEFSFFNRQLASMLREGIPLEGALKQLSTGMRAGPLRSEIEQLERDLSAGTPLANALAKRDLPEMYRRMLRVGTAGNDLPGVLTLVADHYERANALWTRLKGLMVYPALVVIVALGLTTVMSFAFSQFLRHMATSSRELVGSLPRALDPTVVMVAFWMPPLVLAVAVALGVAALSSPQWRGRLRWRLPGFREASLAQLASAMSLMLKNGMPLGEALALAEALETPTPAAKQITQWREMTEQGQGNPTKWPAPAKPFPPLFLWVVQQGKDDLAGGFQKAAELFQARASYRIELLLYGALPVSILLLGQMVLWQAAPLVQALVWMMNMLGDFQ